MLTTYKPINSKQELDEALKTLFQGDELEWVQSYFNGKPKRGSRKNKQHKAFQDGVDAVLQGMFSAQGGRVNIATAPYYMGDGRLDVEELNAMIADEFSANHLENIESRMGGPLYWRFTAVVTALVNGIADKEQGQDAYSVEELQQVLGDKMVEYLYLKEGNAAAFFEGVRGMNLNCAEISQVYMDDALDFDSLNALPNGSTLKQPQKAAARD